MILNKINLFNYGPFCGENTISFVKNGKASSNRYRNIVLIGGKNGSGKTTVFKALQICLYGQSALGRKASRRAYEDYVKEQVHKTNALFSITASFVEVDFDFSVCGMRDNYRVKRTWDTKSNSLTECLDVVKNGKPLDIHEQTYWQDFVKFLIPQGLLQLFFFDGERINSLTQEDNNLELAESVQSLFGLDVVRQLRADLRSFERKQLRSDKAKFLESELSKIDDDMCKVNNELELFRSEKASLRTKIDYKNNEINKLEEKLRLVGGMIGNSRKTLKNKIDEISSGINEKTKQMRMIYQQALPLFYAKEYLQYTVKSIDSETTYRKKSQFIKELMEIWPKVKNRIKKMLKDDTDINSVVNILISDNHKKEKILVHGDLSEIDIAELKRLFQHDINKEKKMVEGYAKDIEALQRAMTDLSRKLEHIPDDSETANYIEAINKFSKEKGTLEGRLIFEEQREKTLQNQLNALERDKERREDEINTLAASDRKLNLTSRTINALQAFEKGLIGRKIEALENNIFSCFVTLLHKGDIIKSIKINKSNFDVLLEDDHNRKVNKNKLSEGEKQIYAVSVLSGITKTTKRALPVLFDTPLSRLDSDHRSNIIHHYFPTASHQLIILSTDTEIDRQYFEELRPYLAHSYLLDFDKNKRQTNIREGYFWKLKIMKVARIKLSNSATNKLRGLQIKTGLTPNILLRIGFGLSLREHAIIYPSKYPDDGKELNRYTITGEFDKAFTTLLREWLARNEKSLDNKTMIEHFRAHLNRGAILLSARIKSLVDLALLD